MNYFTMEGNSKVVTKGNSKGKITIYDNQLNCTYYIFRLSV